MAIRKAEYRFNNNGTWDTVYFKTLAEQVIGLNRSISFGLSGDASVSGRIVPFNRTMQISETFDCDTSIAQISGGNIKLLKTGAYLLNSRFQASRNAGGRAMIVNNSQSGDEETWHYLDYKLNPSLAAFMHGTGTCIRKLNTGTILKNQFEVDSYSGAITIQKVGTILTVVYLGTGA